jgi:aspartyl-tRNA(Asn)/glutamyl-tRNA(Gln) amidotransferase subunit B
LKKAIQSEILRQEKLLLDNKKIPQETRGWNEEKGETVSQRVKEEAQDYRYLPDPDIPPIVLPADQISEIKRQVPELPQEKRKRFASDYKLPQAFIEVLVSDQLRSNYFEEAAKFNNNFKTIADLMVNRNMDTTYPEPAGLVKKLIEITSAVYSTPDEVSSAVTQVITQNDKAVSDFKNGKNDVIGFLIGQVQKTLSGKGNPALIRESLMKKLQ